MKKLILSGLLALFTSACITAPSVGESLPAGLKLDKDVPYYAADFPGSTPYRDSRCRLDVYHPDNGSNLPVVVWFHGGGLNSGSKYCPKPMMVTNLVVVAANYRLTPAVKVENCLEDAAAAVAWTVKNIDRYGGNPEQVFVSGHSAGAYLTAMVGLDVRWLAKHGIDANRLAGLIPLSGQLVTHFTARKERGISDKQTIVDEWAPLYHARKDAPPLLLVTGDRSKDMASRYAENAYMVEMMKLNGHTNTTLYELQGFNHGGMVDPAIPLLQDFVNATLTSKRAKP